MKLQISKKPPNNKDYTVITDAETDGQDCWEEIMNPDRAVLFVSRWNSAPELLEALKNCVIDAKQNLTKPERLQRIRYAEQAIAKAED